MKTTDIIPKPRKLTRQKGVFSKNESELRFKTNYANRLIVKEILGCDCQIDVVPGRTKLYFLNTAGKQDEEETNRIASIGDEGYVLKISRQRIALSANTQQGIFYGLQTLRQIMVRKKRRIIFPCLTITDYPVMQIRAISDDISRGQISKLKDFKDIIRKMASLKLNTYCPYIEDMVKFETHPQIGKGTGCLTKKEVAELVSCGREHHVTVLPIFQSLGHFEKTLKLKPYRNLAEVTSCLRADMEETRNFLQDLYRELFEMFPSRYFHVGCDETWEVGKGKRKDSNRRIEAGKLYVSHIKWLQSLLKKTGRTTLMYADMFKPVSNSGHYDIKFLNELPKDIIMVNWDYTPKKDYPYVLQLKEKGFKQVVSPASSCGLTIFPSRKERFENIKNLLREGIQQKVMGNINSAWCDGGGFNFRENNWLGYAYGAECSWSNFCDNPLNFTRKFMRFYYGINARIADAAYEAAAELQTVFSNNYALFFEEPTIKHHSRQLIQKAKTLFEIVARSEKSIVKLQKKAQRNQESIAYLSFATACAGYVCRRIILTDRAKKVKPHQITTLSKEVAHLKSDFRRLWLSKYKTSGLSENLAKFDVLLRSYKNLDQDLKNGQELIRKTAREGFVPDWKIIGPFENQSGKNKRLGLDAAFFPEKEVDCNRTYRGKENRVVQWCDASVTDDGFLDFYTEYPEINAVAYAYTRVVSERERPAEILFGSDDGAKIWVNGSPVYRELITRSAVKDETSIKINLHQGTNTILVKVEQDVGGWGFFLRLT